MHRIAADKIERKIRLLLAVFCLHCLHGFVVSLIILKKTYDNVKPVLYLTNKPIYIYIGS
jgi:capsular polysaccharide biosynthesis protein